ncbi:MAG: exo-alpha-sialidase, partial [Melioribacteraceae bacterium]|nr:exo-alpha-sialidase [Melioribacteraceae bacterium]
MIKGILIFFLFTGIVSAQFPNYRISKVSSTSPEEVTIAINPADPNKMAAGANLNFFYASSNSGKNWSEDRLHSATLGVWGDPCVIYDALGNLYYAHLSNPVQGYWIDRIVIQKSTDNGNTFDDGIGVGLTYPKNQDKEWLAADCSNSQFKNNIYVAWTEFDDYGSSNPNDSSRILFSRTTNHGNSWSSQIRISDHGGNCIDEDETVEGAVPAVGPDGEVYVAWAGPLGLMFDKSIDGGVTFGKDIFITDQPGGWDFGVPGIYRCNGMPITACDISNSPYRGNVYVGWSDQRNGTDNTDIFFIKSSDKGETWGETIKVNDDQTSRHQFFTWMTIDSTNGNIYFIFYDRRNTIGNETEVYIARSTDGGDSFTNYKISQSSFIPSSTIFFGDYTNIAVYNGVIRPIWMRMDSGDLSVWTANVHDSLLVVGVEEPNNLVTKNYFLYQNYPNPFNPSTIISYAIPSNVRRETQDVRLTVYDVLGRE